MLSIFQVYMEVKNFNVLFNTPLIKLQYLDLSSVFIHVQSMFKNNYFKL